MNELGIIINQEGEYLTYGTWVPRNLKNTQDYSHWHDESFMYQVYNTEWFKNLNIPFDETKRFTSQLDKLTSYGIIIINNIKNDKNDINSTALQISSPNTITKKQIITMESLKDKLFSWSENNYSFIDIIDENGDYDPTEITNLTDYYQYLENQKNKLHR